MNSLLKAILGMEATGEDGYRVTRSRGQYRVEFCCCMDGWMPSGPEIFDNESDAQAHMRMKIEEYDRENAKWESV